MADYRYLVNNGTIVPDTAETLEEVREEFRNAFGSDLDVSPETPQGVLITAETKARDSVIKQNAALANQINPNLAGGIFLDSIWALTGGKRVAATPSILRAVRLYGQPGTLIASGTQARIGHDGPLFELIQSVMLDEKGEADGTFQALENGPISVAPKALDTIVTPILGLENISNPLAAEIGQALKSDQEARLRRRKTLALQGVALPEAIISGLYDKKNLKGVKSLSFLENTSNQPLKIDGVTLAPHSIYACVDGGRDDEIAAQLLHKKSLGCGWNGAITVDVKDPIGGQIYPVSFDRPERIKIWAKVSLRNTKASIDPFRIVRDAMLQYARGELEGEEGFLVGSNVSSFELASAINAKMPAIYVSNLLISKDGRTYTTEEIPIAINQIAFLTAGTIEVIAS
ncbi:baseplate J/gp47 family protein [Bartonella tamiae]|uniref:Baseplate protein J-like barrel domain-containing protein n=1 Tax=Bartonella tamiae Th239 TaxID=1094558 RepID=J0ZL45_9HYPH|nr:baseplate J/gp47 family protein [Bartonella tamiae]EJF89123.1 hypothetical protein ME5_01674 [Bartonella tamiae Th239]EJF95474.1 hypothetical protein MEG_00207 [Bartonella tamiae Th307]